METYNEKINNQSLRIVTDNIEEIYPKLGRWTDKDSNNNLPALKTILNSYCKLKSKTDSIRYGYSKSCTEGRLFSKTTSLQSLPREIRHTISKDIYDDIDISNAHPVLLHSYCVKKEIPCIFLQDWVINRDDHMNRLGDLTGLTRDAIKTEMCKILNGGLLMEELEQDSWIVSLNDELKNVRDKVIGLEPNFYRRTRGQEYNREGKTLNLLMCKLENEVLQTMVNFCRKKNVEVGVLVFDGLMVYKDPNRDMVEFLREMEQDVLLKNEVCIKLVVKPMNDGIDLTGYNVKEDDKSVNEEYSEETIARYFLKQLRDRNDLFFSKKTRKLFLYKKSKKLYEEIPADCLRTLVSEIITPLVDSIPETDKLKRLTLYNSIRSVSYQNKIKQFTLDLLNMEYDDDEFIDAHFDRIKHLFPIADNKVIDFRTKQVRDREKTDYFTKTTSNKYIPHEGIHPFVRQYFSEVLMTDDDDTIKCFLARMGYFLTGENNCKEIMLIVGRGNNGKSVFVQDVVLPIFQRFFTKANPKVFKKPRNEAVHNSELFPLIGNRLAFVSELSEKDEFNTSLLKSISGNDETFSIRQCAKEEVQVVIECKLLLATNEVPCFDDNALANRLKIIEFPNKFENNPNRVDEIRQHREDFFSDFVQAAYNFYQNDKRLPNCLQFDNFTKKKIREVDTVIAYFEENYTRTDSEKDRINKNEVYSDYISSCDQLNLSVCGRNKFYDKIEDIYGLKLKRRQYTKLKRLNNYEENDNFNDDEE